MPNSIVKTITADGTTYDLQDTRISDSDISNWNSSGSGTITKVKTTAGAHTTIDVTSGTASFNVPTKTSHLTNDSGYITSSALNGYLPTTGGTLTGDITTSYNGILKIGTDDVYVGIWDDAGDEELHLYGKDSVTLTGNSIFLEGNTSLSSGKNLTLAQAPTANMHAATKKYVDDSIPTVPSITLNGSPTTSPSFYAPTTAGTSGYYLKSTGNGAPEWAAISAGGVTDVTVAGTSVVTNNVAVIAAPVQIVRW